MNKQILFLIFSLQFYSIYSQNTGYHIQQKTFCLCVSEKIEIQGFIMLPSCCNNVTFTETKYFCNCSDHYYAASLNQNCATFCPSGTVPKKPFIQPICSSDHCSCRCDDMMFIVKKTDNCYDKCSYSLVVKEEPYPTPNVVKNIGYVDSVWSICKCGG